MDNDIEYEEDFGEYQIVKIDEKAPLFEMPYYNPEKDDEGVIHLNDMK